MANTDALEHVAKLLPVERRERFLLLAARLKSVPEDDEYLQVLEAIGFMTLIMTEVPNRLASLLKEAGQQTSAMDESQAKALALELSRSLEAQLDVPSFEDLRRLCQTVSEHSRSLRGALKAAPMLHSTSVEKTANYRFQLGVFLGCGLTTTAYVLLPSLIDWWRF